MAGNLNALGLILVLLLTGMILVRYGAWPRTLWQVASGIAAALAVLFVALCFTTVFYPEANHSRQLLIPSACLALVLGLTRPNRIRSITAIVIALSTFVWSYHVLCLVGPEASYTGDPEWARRSGRWMTLSHLKAVRQTLSETSTADNRDYPNGWVAETELRKLIPDNMLDYTKSKSVMVHPLWHTPLTGLYRKTYHELSLWYPGGRLKDGLQRLEFRPR